MIKNIAYVLLFIIFAIIAFMALTVEKVTKEEEIFNAEFEASRPDYDEASPELIFKKELGN